MTHRPSMGATSPVRHTLAFHSAVCPAYHHNDALIGPSEQRAMSANAIAPRRDPFYAKRPSGR